MPKVHKHKITVLWYENYDSEVFQV